MKSPKPRPRETVLSPARRPRTAAISCVKVITSAAKTQTKDMRTRRKCARPPLKGAKGKPTTVRLSRDPSLVLKFVGALSSMWIVTEPAVWRSPREKFACQTVSRSYSKNPSVAGTGADGGLLLVPHGALVLLFKILVVPKKLLLPYGLAKLYQELCVRPER